jgi:hypothetical protein
MDWYALLAPAIGAMAIVITVMVAILLLSGAI